MLPGMELMNCPNMAVPREVMHHVVRVESSYNPYAIGVVGGRLVRQPRSLPEALATVRMLEDRGYNFSLGLAQVNRYNLVKYGLDSYHKAFQPCANLVAGSQILRECYGRSGGDWGKSFSCYYSGDFKTGYRHGYVQKVYASMRRGLDTSAAVSVTPIAVIDRAQRRVAGAQPPAAAELGTAPGSYSLVDRRGGESHAPVQKTVQPSAFAPAPAEMTVPVNVPRSPAIAAAEAAQAPVIVTATRLVQPAVQAGGGASAVKPPTDGPDNAFVF